MNVNAYEQNKCIFKWRDWMKYTGILYKLASTCDVQYMLLQLNVKWIIMVLCCYFHCYEFVFWPVNE